MSLSNESRPSAEVVQELIDFPKSTSSNYSVKRLMIQHKKTLCQIYKICLEDDREYFKFIAIRGFSQLLENTSSW